MTDSAQMLEKAIRNGKPLVRASGASQRLLDRCGDVSGKNLRQVSVVDLTKISRERRQEVQRLLEVLGHDGFV